MDKPIPTYPLSVLRALILHVQGLSTPLGQEPAPTPEAIFDVVQRLGCVQVDTLQMVHRSQYLALWSRLGSYERAGFDRLVYGDPAAPAEKDHRRLFEDWLHAACILPLAEYRYRLPHKRRLLERPAKRTQMWLDQPGSDGLLQTVLERIRREGPLRISDFPYSGRKRGSWWDWKPAKYALEHLFAIGELMVAGRDQTFQRAYDLRERILPEWVNTTEPTWEEMARHVLERAVRAFGACRPFLAADYVHEIKRAAAGPVVERLLDEGILTLIQSEMCDGRTRRLAVHRDNLPLLEQAADGALPARRTTFLSPFDSLFWVEGRDRRVWGFHQTLEAYRPADRRRWGYFCLPILHGDRLVGRFDVKLERQAGTLRLKALYLEPGIDPEEGLVDAVAEAMRDLMAFHDARDLVVERSEPAGLGERLLAAL